MIGKNRADDGAGGLLVVEIQGVTAPAQFKRLPDAVAAIWNSMRELPLGYTQYEAYRYFFTRPDAVERVAEFVRRDGELVLAFSLAGGRHIVSVRPAAPTRTADVQQPGTLRSPQEQLDDLMSGQVEEP